MGLGLDMKWSGVAKFFGPTSFFLKTLNSLTNGHFFNIFPKTLLKKDFYNIKVLSSFYKMKSLKILFEFLYS